MSELTLTEFLLARIAEDEAAARSGQHWRYRQYGQRMGGEVYHGSALIAEDWVGTGFYGWSEHIARHDPARVLAECEAKRAIVAERDRAEKALVDVLAYPDSAERSVSSAIMRACIATLEGVISLITVPHSTHPDYRAEWTLAR